MEYDKQFIKIAIDGQGQEITFNAQQALKGTTIASKNGEKLLSVENFIQENSGRYRATVNGTEHLFNSEGVCIDDNNVGNLTFVTSDIEKDITNAATSGQEVEEGETPGDATISSLNPRDYFAQEVMNGFMKNVNKPFSMTDADIYKYSTLSYKIAQSMINVSAFNRKADPEEGESTEVQVDTKTLNGNTEKLLNNISVSLNTMAEASEGGGGGESTFDGNLTGWPSTNLGVDLGRGGSSSSPLYVSCNYPSKSILPTMLATDISGFLVYGASNLSYPHGYFTFDGLKDAIVGYIINDTTVLNSLAPAIYNKIEATITALIESKIKEFASDLKTANTPLSTNLVIPNKWQ